uniref:SEA domain-containing protein n=1 Tax=Globodera pallida TaxID=36090 RepID=A0A183CFM2_GLOPA
MGQRMRRRITVLATLIALIASYGAVAEPIANVSEPTTILSSEVTTTTATSLEEPRSTTTENPSSTANHEEETPNHGMIRLDDGDQMDGETEMVPKVAAGEEIAKSDTEMPENVQQRQDEVPKAVQPELADPKGNETEGTLKAEEEEAETEQKQLQKDGAEGKETAKSSEDKAEKGMKEHLQHTVMASGDDPFQTSTITQLTTVQQNEEQQKKEGNKEEKEEKKEESKEKMEEKKERNKEGKEEKEKKEESKEKMEEKKEGNKEVKEEKEKKEEAKEKMEEKNEENKNGKKEAGENDKMERKNEENSGGKEEVNAEKVKESQNEEEKSEGEKETEKGNSPFKVEEAKKPEENATAVPLSEKDVEQPLNIDMAPVHEQQEDGQHEQIQREEESPNSEEGAAHKDGEVIVTEGLNKSHALREEEKPIVFPAEHAEAPNSHFGTDGGGNEEEKEAEEEEKLPQPGRAQITHMGREGDTTPEKEKKKNSDVAEQQKHQHELEIGHFNVNEGSDGFEEITREEAAQPAATTTEERQPHNNQHAFEVVANEGNHDEETSSPSSVMATTILASSPTPTTTVRTETAKSADQTETTPQPRREEAGQDAEGGEKASNGPPGSTDEDIPPPRGPPGVEKPSTEMPLPAEEQPPPSTELPLTTASQTEHAVVVTGEGFKTIALSTARGEGEETHTQKGDLHEETTFVSAPPTISASEEHETTSISTAEEGAKEANEVTETPKGRPTETKPSTDPESAEEVGKHVTDLARAFRTPFLLRLIKIEWRTEFDDLSSGPARKLQEQIRSDLHSALSAAVGPAFLDYQIEALHKGSVIVEGQLMSKDEIADAQNVATALEQAIVSRGGELGGNAVDTEGISVAGLPAHGPSGNTLATNQRQQQEEAQILFCLLLLIVNNRRNNGTLKLKEEICMVENGKGSVAAAAASRFTTDGGGVNLTGLRTTMPGAESASNGHNIGRLTATNGLNGHQPIILSGSQFSTPSAYNAANNRA